MTIIDFNNARRQFDVGFLDVDDIRKRLTEDAYSFVKWLYSNRAGIKGNIARIGDVAGTPGLSLAIQLGGERAGLWHDHATGEGGDLFDLYRARFGQSGDHTFMQSVREIARYYFGEERVEVERSSWQLSPPEIIEADKTRLGTKPHADVELGAPVASYRYYDATGQNIIAIQRRFEPDGTRASKTFRVSPSMPHPRPLYRLPEIAQARSVVLCEGEGKADALAARGIASTSVLGGAGAAPDTDWTPLRGKEVVIWPDNDEPGRKLLAEASARLMAMGCRVRVVAIPAGAQEGDDVGDLIRAGGDPAPLIQAARDLNAGTAPAGTLYELLDVRAIKTMPDPSWLIGGLIVERSMGFIYGPPGCLKTFLGLDIALSLAAKLPEFWGRSIQRHGAVIYISSEGQADLKFRIAAWEINRKTAADDAPFFLIRESINFMKPEDVVKLLATVQAAANKVGPICAVFVDTVSRVLPGAEENLQKDMTLFVNACDAVRQQFDAVVIGIHHTNAMGGMRGSTVMPGAGDFIIEMRREPGAMCGSIFATKIKAAEDGWEQFFEVKKVQIDASLIAPHSLALDAVKERPKQKSGAPSMDVCREILAELHRQWENGTPWGFATNAKRPAIELISHKWKLDEGDVRRLLLDWEENKIVIEDILDRKNHIKGYKKLLSI